MKWLYALFAALMLAAFPAQAFEPVASVEVTRDGDAWTADYQLRRESPVWVLSVSPLTRVDPRSFRLESWTVETPGVRLQRRGWYDVLVADRGNVPTKVRIRFRPFTEDIETAADPALAFTDGSVALYSMQWHAFPVATLAEVERYPIDIGALPASGQPTAVTMVDRSGPVLFDGRRVPKAVLNNRETYVLFGRAQPAPTTAMATLLDPGLPAWFRAFTLKSLPPILDHYTRLLGPRPGGKPTLMISWNGPKPKAASFSGSVLPGLMVMFLEGDGLVAENAKLRDAARWFVAHEGAHFWLGQAVIYSSRRESWITEGGADLLAYRTVAALDPSFDVQGHLRRVLDDCLAASRRGAIATANERNDPKAYYNCGAVFGLIAEQASGGDFGPFVREIIETNRGDKVITRAEWLALLEARARGKNLPRQIEALLDAPTSGPKPWVDLLTAGGIRFQVRPDGSPELL